MTDEPDVWWGDQGIDADIWPKPYERPEPAHATDEGPSNNEATA